MRVDSTRQARRRKYRTNRQATESPDHYQTITASASGQYIEKPKKDVCNRGQTDNPIKEIARREQEDGNPGAPWKRQAEEFRGNPTSPRSYDG